MILSRAKGLVGVSGHSAEPLALDKQFLIIADHVSLKEAGKSLDGHPVIAEDSSQSRYFKRLRVQSNNIILESLEIGGDFPPILLARDYRLAKPISRKSGLSLEFYSTNHEATRQATFIRSE